MSARGINTPDAVAVAVAVFGFLVFFFCKFPEVQWACSEQMQVTFVFALLYR